MILGSFAHKFYLQETSSKEYLTQTLMANQSSKILLRTQSRPVSQLKYEFHPRFGKDNVGLFYQG